MKKRSAQRPFRKGTNGLKKRVTNRDERAAVPRVTRERYLDILHGIEEGYYEVDLAGNMTFFND
jgi:hypothetical protein